MSNEVISTLRFSTAGSVDDGKSTLIGRLLFDSKSIFEDQLLSIGNASTKRGHAKIDLSLLTDGLTAEREQGITIDVAYRYFATDKRRFIIADTPGHEQFTRNMVTGTSTAQVAIVLADASKGILSQTRRHAAVAALLGTPKVVLAINKMDLVGFSQTVFETIKADFEVIAKDLGLAAVTVLPISALNGDNVVSKTVDDVNNLAWFKGPTLLEYLETVDASRVNSTALRFPVQLVSRVKFGANKEHRGYLGQIESGTVRVGEVITVLPSNEEAQILEIITVDGTRDVAYAGEAITLTLNRQLDISRGDLLVNTATGREDGPQSSNTIIANVCWLGNQPLDMSRRYLLKHLTRSIRAVVQAVESKIDIETLQPIAGATSLKANEIGRLKLNCAQPLFIDAYANNSATGSFILIDETTNATVAAGTILLEPSHGK
jgi:sulfate adenylyltransferase subunit 1